MKGREGCPINEPEFTVLHDDGRRGAWKPVNDGQLTHNTSRAKYGDDALCAGGRPNNNLHQAFVDDVKAITFFTLGK